MNALGDSTVYVYDGNGNLVSKTDADGYVTQYSYTALDLVKKINYNVGVLCEERLMWKKSISVTYFEWLRLIRISLHKNWRCDNILLKTTIRSKIRQR